jgi:1-acyl-sn-glycerol-3-phosphate acyltransferase
MRPEQTVEHPVGASAAAVEGPLRRALRLLASLYCWTVLGLTTLVFYASMWVGSALVGQQRSFRRLLHTWSWLTLKLAGFRIDVEGLEGLPRASVLAANHQHYFDIILLGAVLPPPFVFVARTEVLRVPIVGSVLKRGGHVLVRRGGGVANEVTFKLALERLEEGAHVIFFPEGTRSRDGRVRSFKSGAFRLAATAGRPLVPVALAGSRIPIPGGSVYNVPSRLGVALLDPRPVEDAGFRSEAFRDAVRDEIAERLRELEPTTRMRI